MHFHCCLFAAGNEITDVESLQFDLGTIRTATDNFSEDNKLGEGGFGAVYKVYDLKNDERFQIES